jgi:hypothetical protein
MIVIDTPRNLFDKYDDILVFIATADRHLLFYGLTSRAINEDCYHVCTLFQPQSDVKEKNTTFSLMPTL